MTCEPGKRPPAHNPTETAGLKCPPEMGPSAYTPVSTVSPNASATPTKPMPSCGKAAASTALPQPPRTSQNVPRNSAAIFEYMSALPLNTEPSRQRSRSLLRSSWDFHWGARGGGGPEHDAPGADGVLAASIIVRLRATGVPRQCAGIIQPSSTADQGTPMSKGMDRKKETKKKPAKTLEEKRAAKREKRQT